MNAAARAGFDSIVVGGGHNGLTCAAYLARGGRRVLVLEAAARLGGAAVTREFAPGFSTSACAHLLHLMPPSLMRELALQAHGLTLAAVDLPTVALSQDARHLSFGPGNLTALEARSAADAAALSQWQALLERFGRALHPVLSATPPRLGTDAWRDTAALLGLGWRIRRLGRRDMRELLRIGGMCVHDLLEERFASAAAQGCTGTRCGARHELRPALARHRAVAPLPRGSCRRGGLPGAAARGPRCRVRGTGARRGRGGRGNPHGRAGGTHPGARRSCRRSRARLGRGDRGHDRRLERRSQEHVPRAARRRAPRRGLRAAREPGALARARGETAPGARAAAAVPGARRGAAARAPAGRAFRGLHRARLQSRQVRRVLPRADARDHDPDAHRSGPGARRQARHVGHRAVRALQPRRRLGRAAAGLHRPHHRHCWRPTRRSCATVSAPASF